MATFFLRPGCVSSEEERECVTSLSEHAWMPKSRQQNKSASQSLSLLVWRVETLPIEGSAVSMDNSFHSHDDHRKWDSQGLHFHLSFDCYCYCGQILRHFHFSVHLTEREGLKKRTTVPQFTPQAGSYPVTQTQACFTKTLITCERKGRKSSGPLSCPSAPWKTMKIMSV